MPLGGARRLSEVREEEINFEERRNKLKGMFIPLQDYKYKTFFVVKNLNVRELFYLAFSGGFLENFYTV